MCNAQCTHRLPAVLPIICFSVLTEPNGVEETLIIKLNHILYAPFLDDKLHVETGGKQILSVYCLLKIDLNLEILLFYVSLTE